jgi:dolichyl-phosphate-mannose-protein mannosyltransferase
MKQLVYILFAWLFTVVASWCSGKLLLRKFSVRLYREEENVFAFVAGAACLSTAVFFLAALHLVYRPVFLALGLVPIVLAVKRRLWQQQGDALPAVPPVWKLLFFELYLLFAGIYLVYALAPEASPDGTTYHLGLVARYAREHGFAAITTNMYASLSQGMEMLFLFAFVFGRHSAAALVHCTFLLALPWMILNYGRRMGMPEVGVTGGLLIFLSPIFGLDGTSAYNDVAVGTVAFSLFALLEIWAQQRDRALLVPIGLLAGFAFGIKYTAFVAVPYALALVAYECWRSRQPVLRPVLTVAATAAALILPTLVKNSIVVHNPVAPFFNRLFPNPYVHASMEDSYTSNLRTYRKISSGWEIPWEVTVAGDNLQGLLGPIFLLAPLALLALRRAAGRRLLLAALVFALPYPMNIGTRFLLPCAVFVAPALALGISAWKPLLALLVFVHALLSWPANVKDYCNQSAPKLGNFPARAAFRLEPEDAYLFFHMNNYLLSRKIEIETPPGSRIFSFSNVAEAYCAREILVSFQAALNERLRDTLYAGFNPDFQPVRAFTFHIQPAPVRRLRLVQTASGRHEMPGITEVEISGPQGELPPSAGRRITAHPFPWDAELAFDHNLVTQWRAWQPMKPGMSVEVDLASQQVVSSVRLKITGDQTVMRWRLEGAQADGRWSVLSSAAELSALAVPENLNLRRAATEQLKQNGVRYIVVSDTHYSAPDFRDHMREWGISLVDIVGIDRIYKIE